MALTYEPVATTLLTTTASTITFSGLPQTYTDLVLILNTINSSNNTQFIRVNNDSGANYCWRALYTTVNTTTIAVSDNTRTNWSIMSALGGADATRPSMGVFNFPNYRNTNQLRNIFGQFGLAYQGTFGESVLMHGTWNNSSAITRIDISRTAGNFNAGTTATIYGILAA